MPHSNTDPLPSPMKSYLWGMKDWGLFLTGTGGGGAGFLEGRGVDFGVPIFFNSLESVRQEKKIKSRQDTGV